MTPLRAAFDDGGGPLRRGTTRGALAAYRGWHRVRDKAFSLAIRGSFASFGPRSVIQPPFRVYGEERISVGADVWIGFDSWLEAIDEVPGVTSTIEIGDGFSASGSCVISAAQEIRVGRSVLFARNVYVSDHNHAYRDPTRPVADQGVDKVAPVEICDGAWLAQNVVVTPGVRIGRGAVVGANSVVSVDVPDHSLAVGAPARIVRRFA